MFKKIEISFIDPTEHRFPTVGDWYCKNSYGEIVEDGETLVIVASKFDDWKRSLRVAVHELIEAYLCKKDGIKESDIYKYDITHPLAGGEEVDMLDAPYIDQHSKAITVERLMCHFDGDSWGHYCQDVERIAKLSEK